MLENFPKQRLKEKQVRQNIAQKINKQEPNYFQTNTPLSFFYGYLFQGDTLLENGCAVKGRKYCLKQLI